MKNWTYENLYICPLVHAIIIHITIAQALVMESIAHYWSEALCLHLSPSTYFISAPYFSHDLSIRHVAYRDAAPRILEVMPG